MHNLGTVFRFEVSRTLKKKSFWITALSFPVIIGLVFAIIYFSNKSTDEASQNMKNQKFSLVVSDPSNLVNDAAIKQLNASKTSDSASAIQKVKDGKLDAFFEYPADLTKSKVNVYAKDVGLFNNGKYDSVAKSLLQISASQKVDPQTTLILQDKVNSTAITYKDGQPFDGFKELILPGVFLVLFYILITMFGNQMLTSTTEEKENRVIEMILTTIEARTLIIGKILSLVVLAFLQILVILVPLVIGFLLFKDNLNLPNIDLSNIPVDPLRILMSALIFIFSFLLFTGLLVAVGAAAPTAKEASGFFGMVMILLFGPLYAFSLFISMPDSPIVQVLSYFPFTAPIPLLLRNAVGNLPTTDALISIVILAVSAVIVLSIAVRLFRYGALEYSKRLSLGILFSKRS